MPNEAVKNIDWDDVNLSVYLRDGTIVVDSRFLANLAEQDLFFACVEDNIIDTPDGEQIDWTGVRKDFDAVHNRRGAE